MKENATMPTNRPDNDVRRVRVPKLGELIRVAHMIEGGAIVVQYYWPKTRKRVDRATVTAPIPVQAGPLHLA
jgi:hypothetical protein